MERLGVFKPVQKTCENGAIVKARRLDTSPRPFPGSVAVHEAAHVVAAGKIVFATITPSGNALGTTQPVEMTAAAAAAPEAIGCEGTGWDMFLTEHILGVDPGSAKSAARSALSGKEEEMHEVATILEERRTIGQRDVEKARENVRRKREGRHPIEVEIISPTGQRKSFKMESSRGEVKIEDGLLKFPEPTAQEENRELPKAA